ncbi:uncharacterized protein B0P05DRAFT_554699 [Gilbertella persicaria]|uniref:uncharacterized protein n=1 Tax=Gilbertella persicaria TaxID=101096 RepID=UPI00221E3A4A|nr:uncharacterized protein B0P05DRAFT_554699 [Gilbertella persicaria]KAI8064869.1 hypothetical protein B0P05DRAFT_554699 [Gilbertella persicaria]
MRLMAFFYYCVSCSFVSFNVGFIMAMRRQSFLCIMEGIRFLCTRNRRVRHLLHTFFHSFKGFNSRSNMGIRSMIGKASLRIKVIINMVSYKVIIIIVKQVYRRSARINFVTLFLYEYIFILMNMQLT